MLASLLVFALSALPTDGGAPADAGAAPTALDGGVEKDPATRFIEAAQQLQPVDAGMPPGPRIDEAEVKEALARHQTLTGAVPIDLPPVDAFEGLSALRTQAETAATSLSAREADWKKKPPLASAQNVKDALAELSDADQKLSSGIDAALKNLTGKVQPTAVVVSGGVSLGAYQAGLLHFYTQYLLQHRAAVAKFAPDLLAEPVTATGASAGSINAFLSAISICRTPVTRPEDSLFWRVWLPVGFDGLINLDDVTTYSLLSRKPIDHAVQLVREAWNDQGWRKDPCRINLGFSVTREVPRSIPLNKAETRDSGQVRLPIQTERVVIVMEGDGTKSPSIKSWTPRDDAKDRDFFVDFDLHAPSGGAFPDGLAKILQASSAFPVAWPPVLLHMRAEPSYAYFLDGGVFDNNPVRLATKLLDLSDSKTESRVSNGIAQSRLKKQLPSRLLYVEPDATPWQDDLVAEVKRRESFVSMYSQLVFSLVGTARKAELVSTIEADETLRDRIDVPLRPWPITGSFMLNFFAFLEEDFRRFDFYSGMADAWEFLHSSDETSVERMGLSDVHVDSPEFDCVLQFRKGNGEVKAREVPACLALLNASGKDENAHRHAKNLLALLDTSARVRDAVHNCIAVKNCEAGLEFNVLSKGLADNGYEFQDPSLQKQSVIGAVRERLHPVLETFAKRQPFPDSAAVSLVGKAGLDALSVRPSSWYLGFGILSRSGGEVEYSRRVAGPWRPLTFGFRLMRFQSRFLEAHGGGGAEERYSATWEGYWHPLALEFNPVPPWWWFRLGVAGGMAAETTLLDWSPAVARFPFELSATALFLQRFYIRAIYKNYALDGCPDSRCLLLNDDARADPAQVAGIRADWTVAIGWRFID